MSAHTPGRLHVGERNVEIVYDADGWAVCNATVFHGRHPDMQAENARRLAACWNACEGLDTGFIEGAAEKRVANQLVNFDQIVRQRDELLVTMHLIQHATAPTHDDGGHHEAAHDLAAAAIAKATGSAPCAA